MIPLSKGAITRIMKGDEVDKPIVQILSIKKLASGGSAGADRYRLLISDGDVLSSFTMLATQLNSMVTENTIDIYAIIEISRYAMSKANTGGGHAKTIMIVLGIEVKVKGDVVKCKIGDPVNYELTVGSSDTNSSSAASAAPAAPAAPAAASINGNSSTLQLNNRVVPPANRLNDSLNAGMEIQTTPIAALSPYQNKWVIKARVSNKSDIKIWNNSRSSGKLFNMELIDESGEIRCTVFQEQVDKFFDMIEIQKLYYISRASIKMANKQYNSLKNDYEMSLTGDSEIIACNEESDAIPLMTYEFVPIKEIENMEKDTMVDILGIVKSADNLVELTSKAGKEFKKRDIHLIDESKVLISLTLWGNQAENFQSNSNPVIAIKSAKIGEFNGGKTLSAQMSSVLQIDPDIPQAHALRGWFASIDANSEEIQSLSKTNSAGGMSGNWSMIREATARGMQARDMPETFICKAMINMVRTDNIMYKACPSDNCNKKVIDNDGVYRCEKCNQDYQNYKPRLLANMAISDWSSSVWATAFHDDVERMVGLSAQELQELQQVNSDEFNKKITSLAFQPFLFKLRMKMGMYNDQPKMNTSISAVTPVDYKAYNKHLLKKIKEAANITTSK